MSMWIVNKWFIPWIQRTFASEARHWVSRHKEASLLPRNVYLSLPLIFWLGYLFFGIEFCELFVYLGDRFLSVALFANIFSFLGSSSHRVDGFFFAVEKLLSLIRSRLFIFALISFTLGDIQRNIAMIYVRVFCLCFPLGVLWFFLLHLGL